MQLRVRVDVLDDNIIQGLVFPNGALDEVVEVVDVGLVMLAVVVVEGLGRNGLTKGRFVVGEFWQFEAHLNLDVSLPENLEHIYM